MTEHERTYPDRDDWYDDPLRYKPSRLDQIEAELRLLEDRDIASFDHDGVDWDRYCALCNERDQLLQEKP